MRRHKKKTGHAKSSTNIIFEVKRFSMPSLRSLKCSFAGKGLKRVDWSRQLFASVFIVRGNRQMTN